MKDEQLNSEIKNTQNFKFFSHAKCEYFPCHKGANPNDFNCLFCYCPLYALGDKCTGNFTYTKEGLKDCSKCLLPHKRENYDYITSKYKQIVNMIKKVGADKM